MAIGVICYVFGYNYSSTSVLAFCFMMNIILGLYKLVGYGDDNVQIGDRYGVDYIAYLQQATAVWNGERDYTKLSSN